MVMVTTIYPGRAYDGACVLDVGDHPFITHKSYMLYRMAETIRAEQIAKRIGQNYYIPKEDFESSVFNRIVAGLYGSENTKGRILKYAKSNRI